jgi:fibro-slime domain-containing protein
LSFQSDEFFPIDDELLGNEGRPHNYHFTIQLKTTFIRNGGELISFTGDDDMFVFVNRVLALDLGGVHSPESGFVDVDAIADEIGVAAGETYDVDLFFAERHTTGSTFGLVLSSFELCEPR